MSDNWVEWAAAFLAALVVSALIYAGAFAWGAFVEWSAAMQPEDTPTAPAEPT